MAGRAVGLRRGEPWGGAALTRWALRSPERPAEIADDPAPEAPFAAPLEGRERAFAIGLFALVASTGAFIFGAMSVHLPAVLQAHGLDAATAVGLAALKGVAQVAGRLAEIVFGGGFTAIAVGRFSTALMPVSFLVLMLAGASFWERWLSSRFSAWPTG